MKRAKVAKKGGEKNYLYRQYRIALHLIFTLLAN